MKDYKHMCLTGVIAFVCVFLLSGCIHKDNIENDTQPAAETDQSMRETSQNPENDMENLDPETVGPIIVDADWSDCFNGLNGTAVFYDAAINQYTIYNQELANEQRSPCSTFKIISSLIGLESGVITPADSTRTWSGEIFWNEDWNKDIDFGEAFRTSCVWYYREVIDEIGRETVQNELNRLQYGNRDISDWEGRMNTNNNNRALTGFWIESSLKISPMEQVQVMERIFDTDTIYKSESIQQLKQVMLVTGHETGNLIYGKTGMGKAAGVVVDSWFTGFVSGGESNIYFCIYLGETAGADVSSAKAKDIALKIISEYY